MRTNSEWKQPLYTVLQRCYDDAFTELPSYNFIPPQRVSALFPVTLPGKVCHCLSCGQTAEVAYIPGSVVYADTGCLASQRALYQKYARCFPATENNAPLIYLQEGYCTACSSNLADSSDAGQAVYTLSSRLVAATVQLLPSLLPTIKRAIKKTDHRASLQAVKENTEAQKICKDYADLSAALVQQIASLLAAIKTATFTAYTGRPLTMIDPMSATLFNEYTVAVPVETTPACWFYIKSTIKKEKVERFLAVSPMATVEEVLAAPGVLV